MCMQAGKWTGSYIALFYSTVALKDLYMKAGRYCFNFVLDFGAFIADPVNSGGPNFILMQIMV